MIVARRGLYRERCDVNAKLMLDKPISVRIFNLHVVNEQDSRSESAAELTLSNWFPIFFFFATLLWHDGNDVNKWNRFFFLFFFPPPKLTVANERQITTPRRKLIASTGTHSGLERHVIKLSMQTPRTFFAILSRGCDFVFYSLLCSRGGTAFWKCTAFSYAANALSLLIAERNIFPLVPFIPRKR